MPAVPDHGDGGGGVERGERSFGDDGGMRGTGENGEFPGKPVGTLPPGLCAEKNRRMDGEYAQGTRKLRKSPIDKIDKSSYTFTISL